MGMSAQPYVSEPYPDSSVASPSRILVVDDDASLVHLLKEDLELEGYHVSAAYDGQMGLRCALNEPFNLIILDVNMPMTNGFKVFEYLRANPGTARIPVIFVTGEISNDVYPVIERSPRAAHMKKPVDLEGLNSLVRHYLERYPTD